VPSCAEAEKGLSIRSQEFLAVRHGKGGAVALDDYLIVFIGDGECIAGERQDFFFHGQDGGFVEAVIWVWTHGRVDGLELDCHNVRLIVMMVETKLIVVGREEEVIKTN
jgi:hypothetical protein